MQRRLVQIFGVVIAILAVAGLFVEGRHLFGLMNVDIVHDMVRIVVAAIVLYVGFSENGEQYTRGTLAGLGVLYFAIGLLGIASPELGGLFPTGLTGFDIAYHLIGGLIAAIAAAMPTTYHHHHTALHT